MDRIDVRLADARNLDELAGPPRPTGRSALWARLPDVLDMSAATLAILGDYVPFGIGQALGAQAGGNSLDNTLRVARLVPTEWVLLDIRVHAVATASATASSTSGPTTARCWPRPASPRSSASGTAA